MIQLLSYNATPSLCSMTRRAVVQPQGKVGQSPKPFQSVSSSLSWSCPICTQRTPSFSIGVPRALLGSSGSGTLIIKNKTTKTFYILSFLAQNEYIFCFVIFKFYCIIIHIFFVFVFKY